MSQNPSVYLRRVWKLYFDFECSTVFIPKTHQSTDPSILRTTFLIPISGEIGLENAHDT